MTSLPTFTVYVVKRDPNRQTVVLLPGAGATISVWSRQVRAFLRDFNLVLVDFPGHARRRVSRRGTASTSVDGYSFDQLVTGLTISLHQTGLTRYHLVAMSLGTILGRLLTERHPDQVLSATFSGTIAALTPVPYALMKTGQYARHVLPYMCLYRLYAWAIMPGRFHRRTRMLFYRDAKGLGRAEFNRWFMLTDAVVPLLKNLRDRRVRVPTLHIMGEYDHMFRRPAEQLSATDGSEFAIVRGVGHVCSVEAPETFNALTLDFMRRVAAKL